MVVRQIDTFVVITVSTDIQPSCVEGRVSNSLKRGIGMTAPDVMAQKLRGFCGGEVISGDPPTEGTFYGWLASSSAEVDS